MVIYRLKRWLSKLRSSLMASLRSNPESRFTSPYSGHAMATTTGRDTTHDAGTSGSATSWLDDSRRMRPLMRSRPTLAHRPPKAPSHPPLADQPKRNPPAAKMPLTPRSDEADPSIMPIGVPAPEGKASADDVSGKDQRVSPYGGINDRLLRQRLMALRRLVRMGIYNEGFDAHKLPTQYFYSTGRDADGNPLDD